MTTIQAVAAIAVMAGITFLTRALPFLIFGRGKVVPSFVIYLGHTLPPAVIMLLIVYCLRTIRFSEPALWIPQLAAGLVVILLHLWKRNNLFSIFGGTALYMVLVQVAFR